MKKLILLLIFIFVSIFAVNPAFAENFYIENYDVKMNVNEDKSVDVIENIDVVFTAPSHGIYRTIPLQNNKIKNIKVSEQKKIENDRTTVNIKIGSPDKFIHGKHNYQLSYTYHFLDNKNEFYYNIIGTDWNTTISKVTFSITMPKNIDANKVGLSIGKYGTKGFEDGAVFKVYENKILGNIYKELRPYEGVTIRAEVDQGYFSESSIKKEHNIIHNIALIAIIILTIISILIWYYFGKDDHVTPVVSFYPPAGINAAETEIISKGKCSFKGLVALLIELAGKGYIDIEENSSKNSFTLKKIDIEKVQQKEKLGLIENDFLNIIFAGNTSVSKSELEKSPVFYKKCQDLINKINKKISQHYETSTKRTLFHMLLLFCFISIILLMIGGLFDFNIPKDSQYSISLFYLPFVFILTPMFIRNFSITTLISVISICIYCVISFLYFGEKYSINNIVYTGIICAIISGICLYFYPKRNRFGTKLEGQLRGLKHFIEVANKQRLETLVEKNPKYFYSILPYAYILDVSNKWIENFESIVMPRYNDNISVYRNIHTFNNFTNLFYNCTQPSTLNGGITYSYSGGGGGFSGGGGGGGGGRSW